MSDRTPTGIDLRERMQRVATKPAVSRRRAPVLALEPVVLDGEVQTRARVRGPRSQRRATPRRAPSRAARTTRSRLRTLLSWARWEVAYIPRARIDWLRQLVRGTGTATPRG